MYSTSFLLSADEQPNSSLDSIVSLFNRPSRVGVCPLSLYKGEVAYKGRNPNGIFDWTNYFTKPLW